MSLLEEVRFEASFQRLRYLLLARTRTVGEGQLLSDVRDKDGLCYDRWHLALEQYARGELVRRSRGYGSRTVCRGQGRERPEDGVGQGLVLARLAVKRGGVVDLFFGRGVHVDRDQHVRSWMRSLQRVGADVAIAVGERGVVGIAIVGIAG